MELLFYPPDGVVLCISGALHCVEIGEQEVLELRELEEIMLLVPELRFRTADFADRFLYLAGL